MREIYYKLCCFLHKSIKILLFKYPLINKFKFIDVDETKHTLTFNSEYINDRKLKKDELVQISELFPCENAVKNNSNLNFHKSFSIRTKNHIFGVTQENAEVLWNQFIENSKIPPPFKNNGFHYGGYILDRKNHWCLPSWIWTNAALVRYYCSSSLISEAENIGMLFLNNQHPSGGWIVRNDYSIDGCRPILAPNDSAFIANNCFLELYSKTKKKIYLDVAVKCADWIIETARDDGIVWTGFDVSNNSWVKDYIIVDTAFTAALFANLSKYLSEEKYACFLEKFTTCFINVFFNSKRGFCPSSIDSKGNHIGGVFARGQAWVLEGLIPAYKVTKRDDLKFVIDSICDNLIKKQLKNGGWHYNFNKPYLGEDCKGIPVIAKALSEWHSIFKDKRIISSISKALSWSREHTSISDDFSKGGIFSFNMEGAIVHNNYSSVALVYSSVYALELKRYYESNSPNDKLLFQ